MRLPAVSRLQLALAAGAFGVACGAAAQRNLPAAGSERDDGTGVLATASVRLAISAARYGGVSYGGAHYSQPSQYGGGRYANYHFESRSRHRGYVSTYLPEYTVDHTRSSGRIAGSVSWSSLPNVPVPAGCPAPPPVPSRAIVSLSGVRRGRGFPDARLRDQGRFQLGGVVELGRCGFEPPVQAVGPIGMLGTAVSHRAKKARILGVMSGRSEVLFDLSFASPGERRPFELSAPGVVELSTDGDERGWIVVVGHPLFVEVDPDGRFALEDVPAGAHTLAVWHPPVIGGPPIEVSRRVVVRAGQTTRVSLGISP